MAQLKNNPMSCTTADTFPLTLFNHWAQIHHFEFQKMASGDTVLVKDQLGNIVWETTAPSDLDPVISEPIGDVCGLVVSSFSSTAGILLIFFN